MALAAAAATAIALLGSPGCAGASVARVVAIESGRRTTVRLMQFVDGKVFTLQNASSGTAREVYSDAGTDDLTKVVADAQLQALVDVFAEEGLFARAAPSAPAAARDAIVIAQDGRRLVLHAHGLDPNGQLAYSRARAYFLAVYNQAVAYHSSDIDERALKEEQERASYDGQQAVRNLEKQKGKKQ